MSLWKKIVNWFRPTDVEIFELMQMRVRSKEEAESLMKWIQFRLKHPVISVFMQVFCEIAVSTLGLKKI